MKIVFVLLVLAYFSGEIISLIQMVLSLPSFIHYSLLIFLVVFFYRKHSDKKEKMEEFEEMEEVGYHIREAKKYANKVGESSTLRTQLSYAHKAYEVLLEIQENFPSNSQSKTIQKDIKNLSTAIKILPVNSFITKANKSEENGNDRQTIKHLKEALRLYEKEGLNDEDFRSIFSNQKQWRGLKKSLINRLNELDSEPEGGDNPHQATRNLGIFILSNWLGLRSKELAALKVKDVYENGKVKDTLRLLAGYTKGEKHRDLALANPEVIKTIRATVVAQEEQYHRINSEAPLFCSNRGSSFSANSMRRVLKTIYIDAGYPDASSHSGRRSMITRLAEKGIDVNSIRIIAGHSSLQTTQRYIEENPARLANILKGL